MRWWTSPQEPALWANVLRLAMDELLFQNRAPDAWELLSRCCEPYQGAARSPQQTAMALLGNVRAGLFASPPDRRGAFRL